MNKARVTTLASSLAAAALVSRPLKDGGWTVLISLV